MPLEPEGFREQLARLSERFPNLEAISIKDVCAIVGRDRRALLKDKTFPKKKISGHYAIPLAKLAWWMTS